MAGSRSMSSRTGRNNQRYGPNGERLVAGVVPLSEDKYYVLLIQSTRRGAWVLPKGGWETDEASPAEAAIREAWEEAGITCRINYDLGKVPEIKDGEVKAEYNFFEATVEKQETQWPEMHKRQRMWMTFAQAETALSERPELLAALRACTMKR